MVLAKKNAVGAEYYHYSPSESSQPVSQPQYKTKKQFKIGKAISSIGIIFILGILITFQHAQVANLGYTVDSLKNNIAEIQKENELLRSKIANLSSLTRIEEIATNKLGMVKPQNIQYVMASTEQSNSSTVKDSEDKKHVGNQWLTAVTQFFYQGFSDDTQQ